MPRGRWGPRTAEDNEKTRQGHLGRREQERKDNKLSQSKRCSKCKEVKAFTDFSPGEGINGLEARCKPCMVTKASGWNKTHRRSRSDNEKKYCDTDKGRLRDIRAQCRRMGVTLEVREAIYLRQNKRCAACREPIPLMSKKSHLDHCHKTGVIRGILCSGCNAALGYTRDNRKILQALIEYLSDNG